MDPLSLLAIGAPMAGGLMSMFGKSQPAQTTQIPKFNEQQQNALNQLLGQGLAGLGGNAQENEARRGFAQKTIPTIAERFAGMDALGSSGFRNSMMSAGADLESSIAGMKQGNLMNLLQLGLQPQNETFYQQERPGMTQQIGASMLQGLPQSLSLLSKQSENANMMEMFKKLFGGQESSDIGMQGQIPQLPDQFGLSGKSPLMNLLSTLSNASTFLRN